MSSSSRSFFVAVQEALQRKSNVLQTEDAQSLVFSYCHGSQINWMQCVDTISSDCNILFASFGFQSTIKQQQQQQQQQKRQKQSQQAVSEEKSILPSTAPSTSFVVDIISSKNSNSNSINGQNRAKLLASLFRSLLLLLRELIRIGCMGGAVSPNLTTLVSLFTNVLAIHLDENTTSQAKKSIQNEKGVSEQDVFLILPSLKEACLKTFNVILQTQNSGLMRFATPLSNALFALITDAQSISAASRSTSTHDLIVTMFACVVSLIQQYPTLLSRPTSHQAINVLIDVYGLEIQLLTQSRMTVMNEDAHAAHDSLSSEMILKQSKQNTKEKNHRQQQQQQQTSTSSSSSSSTIVSDENEDRVMDPLYIDYFQALSTVVEMILLYSGSLVTLKVREKIEEANGKSLSCLSRGLLPYQPADRHLRRSQCELLRLFPLLQAAVLNVTTMEILIPNHDSMISGNVTLMKQVCQSCLVQSVTTVVAAKALAVIDLIAFPSSLTLPSNHHVLLSRNLLSLFPNGTSSYSMDSTPNSNVGNNDKHDVLPTINDEATPVETKLPTQTTATNSDTVEPSSSRKLQEKGSKRAVSIKAPLETTSYEFSASAKKSRVNDKNTHEKDTTVVPSGNIGNADDEDDLPDINME